MNSEIDPTLLAELREAHLSERASAELERSVLARVLSARGGVRGSVAPLGARARAVSNRIVVGAALALTAMGAIYLGSQALSIGERSELGPEPRRAAAGDARKAASCQLDGLPPCGGR